MGNRFFTSDWHLNSSNIVKYANRQFKDGQHHTYETISMANSMAKKCDYVIHVGDFCLESSDKHDLANGEDVPVTSFKTDDFVGMVDAKIVLLEGNHDTGHNGEAVCKNMLLDLNQNYRNVSVSHYPTSHKQYRGITGKNGELHIHLCGHVHDKWVLHYDKENNALNINVGVDVWKHKLVRDAELTLMLDFIFANGRNLFKLQEPGFNHWNRNRWDKWVLKVNGELEAARKQRREDKLKKKGLTPEECERRKLEAMKKKGLI